MPTSKNCQLVKLECLDLGQNLLSYSVLNDWDLESIIDLVAWRQMNKYLASHKVKETGYCNQEQLADRRIMFKVERKGALLARELARDDINSLE
jgi:hypothetical protein